MAAQLEHTIIRTNGINLHVVQTGAADGKVVILLHGFPEFWYGWRNQIDYLAEHGYRVLVPDQRGYNLSDKPAGVAAYNQDQLTADILGLIDATGRDKVCLIGHDWGGAVAWWLAFKHPERLDRLVILNSPHHKIFARALRTSSAQRRKSWYMVFFQTRRLPEWVVRRGNWHWFIRSVFQGSAAFTAEDIEQYRQAWSQPGAMTAMINWYRASRLAPHPADWRVHVPTLLIWGKGDSALGAELAQPSIAMCDQGRLVFIDHASHWVQHEAADQVNHWIGEFLAESSGRTDVSAPI